MRINADIGFIHIPKTGGQSIEKCLLFEVAGTREQALLRPNNDPSMGPPRLAHLTQSEYAKYYDYRPRKWFSLIRNPADRFVSEVKFRGLSTSEAEVYLNKIIFNLLEDDYVAGEDYLRHVIPQVNYIQDRSQVLLMRFEDFFLDPERHLSSVLGRTLNAKVPHIRPRATQRKIDKIKITRTSLRKLEEHYAADFELWKKCAPQSWTYWAT
ncbi:sulfotransferase domain-containing protein [Sulfitobacter sp. 1A13368]|uniref:sulfotransferase domain-containing protein n=1 Tax=Sulfitobacter sp. 1A13368 TaxID=3368593 RepID=UPI003746F225